MTDTEQDGPVDQTHIDEETLGAEELHDEIQDTLGELDDRLTELLPRLGELRDKFDKSDPNHAKVHSWYVKLLTKNVISDVIDEMDGTEADPDGDDKPVESEVVISLSKARARALLQAAKHVDDAVAMGDDDDLSAAIIDLETAL